MLYLRRSRGYSSKYAIIVLDLTNLQVEYDNILVSKLHITPDKCFDGELHFIFYRQEEPLKKRMFPFEARSGTQYALLIFGLQDCKLCAVLIHFPPLDLLL